MDGTVRRMEHEEVFPHRCAIAYFLEESPAIVPGDTEWDISTGDYGESHSGANRK